MFKSKEEKFDNSKSNKKGSSTTPKEIKVMSSLAPKVLTDKEDLDKVQSYLNKLKDVIDEEDINNIALMGNYGSGKSTIIKTFQHQHKKEYRFLNISLASFNKPNVKEKEKEVESEEIDYLEKLNKEKLDRLLEVSILQQIFYHVKASDIPKSRFKRIIELPIKKLIGEAILFVIWVICSVLTIKYDYLNKINPIIWKSNESFDFLAFFILLITFSGLGYSFIYLIEIFGNSKITKVNIKGELELGEDVSKSILNEHLDEIFYFFEKTKYNVVVIEDLDRFKSTDIFSKLREINILLNNSNSIGREIKFVYAVGDFLFKDKKERVKFFEYIIPIIPFINSSNAEVQLKKLIKESELEEDDLSDNFISDVVAFIDDIDMRLLLNIFHEFVIYRKTILRSDFVRSNEELFAIIIYKNLYPNDFAILNDKKGNLYSLINNKRIYIKKFLEEIDENITNNNKRVKIIEREFIDDIKDLQSIYINKIVSIIPNHDTYVDREFLESDFSQIINNTKVEYIEYNGNYRRYDRRQINYKFSEVEKEVNPKSYTERVKLIEDKNDRKDKSLKDENQKLRAKRSEIQNWDLKQIFNEIDISEYLEGELNNGLFRNLILNGYINENYRDYITLFHNGGSLTKEDSIFEKNVRGGYNDEFQYKLSNIENLVDKLKEEKYFQRDSILNFDLLDFLGENYDKYSSKYDSIIKLLSNEKEKSIEFIDQYINRGDKTLDIFIEKLTLLWGNFWFYIYCESDYIDERKKEYLRLIFLNTSNKDIIENQNFSVLIDSISETVMFQLLVEEFDEENINKAKGLIEELEIKFSSLTPPNNKTKEFFDFVYNNNHYLLNQDNVSLVLDIYGENIDKENIKKRNYTTILNSKLDPLINYVESNIDDYVENVFLKLSDNKNEEEEKLISLLNNKKLKEELKIKIIKTTDTLINNLNEIKKGKIKEGLLKNNKIVSKWDNVVDYYNTDDNKLNSSLIEYLNEDKVYKKLGEERMTLQSEDFDYPEFQKNILLCDEIENESYTTLLNETPYKWNELPVKDISGEKVQYLVSKVLNTTKYNYEQLREHYKVYHIGLIENDFDKFLNNNDDFETNESDVMSILKSTKISDGDKLQYVPLIDQQIISESKVISELISKLIVSNRAEIIDLDYLVFESIISNTTSIKSNVKVINLNYGNFDNVQKSTLVGLISEEYKKIFVKRSKTLFDSTDYNEELFKNLDSNDLISSVNPKKSNKLLVVGNY